MTINILEGVDYTAKTVSAGILTRKFGFKNYSLNVSFEEKLILNSLNIEDRFNRYFDLNMQLYNEVLKDQYEKNDKALIERLWPSTIVYHNVLLKKRLEDETCVFEKICSMRPDNIILLTATEEAIKRRMRKRQPSHQYESDIKLLLDVQNEYLRFLSWVQKEMNISLFVVDNSAEYVQDIEKSIDVLKVIK